MNNKKIKNMMCSAVLMSSFAAAVMLPVQDAKADLLDPANPLSPLNPLNPLNPIDPYGIYSDDESSQEKARREAEDQARKQELLAIREDVRVAIADPKSNASQIKMALKGHSFRNFDADDADYIDSCRKEVLLNAYKKATSEEVDKLIKCMHKKDRNAKWQVAKPYVAGGAATLAVLGLAGFAWSRRRS